MELASLIATIVLTLGIALWGWHKISIDKDRDELAKQAADKLKRCEEESREAERHRNQLEIRIVKLESSEEHTTPAIEKLSDKLSDVESNMVRRDDFDAAMDSLGRRIDDALRNKRQ